MIAQPKIRSLFFKTSLYNRIPTSPKVAKPSKELLLGLRRL